MPAGVYSQHTWQGVLASGGGKGSSCSSLPLLSNQNDKKEKNSETEPPLHPELLCRESVTLYGLLLSCSIFFPSARKVGGVKNKREALERLF